MGKSGKNHGGVSKRIQIYLDAAPRLAQIRGRSVTEYRKLIESNLPEVVREAAEVIVSYSRPNERVRRDLIEAISRVKRAYRYSLVHGLEIERPYAKSTGEEIPDLDPECISRKLHEAFRWLGKEPRFVKLVDKILVRQELN